MTESVDADLLVRAMYRALLGREPDSDGLKAHVRLFARGITDAAIISALTGIMNSKEFARRFANTEPVRYGIPTDQVTVAMIVQNEEALLPYALRALTDNFDRFVFLDLASTDRTREIINGIAGDRASVTEVDRYYILSNGFAAARVTGAKPWAPQPVRRVGFSL
jgi:hypothetical protein